MSREVMIDPGTKFGRLTVVKEITERGYSRYFLCKCDCGNEKTVRMDHLRHGEIMSCGCLLKEKARMINFKHGLSSTPSHRDKLYKTWDSMKSRCYNPHDKSYLRYGGRGIKICDEWKTNYILFRTWALENGYSKELTIDRIDVNGNYEPDNCRWVDLTVQANNKRNNVFITYNNETHTLAEWARITGIEYRVLSARYRRGLPLERVFFVGNLRENREDK